ncbi:MAG: DUF3800 domain-containing protein [Christensenellales bacterium]
MTIDDIQYAELVAAQPGRSAYIDESGSFGFDFTKEGTSSHYVVCAVIVDNANIPSIEKKVAEIRNTLFGGKEMKSSSIGSKHGRRAKVLTELLLLDFQLIVMIADKRKFYEDSPLTEYKTAFKKFLNRRLYDAMYLAYPKLKIIEDEYGTDEFQQGYRSYVQEHRPVCNIFNEYDFDYADSKNSSIVQIADIIAGSVMQHLLDPSAPDVLRIFQSRITDVVKFPDDYEIYRPSERPTEHDNAIYQLACKCATDYINEHRDSEDEEVRLRSLFLRLLLYNVRMYSSSRYVHSGEIVQELSRLTKKRVTKDFLYRRIIAPLRDDGVLIASSAHGYKIPTRAADIATYVNQTASVVGPMLSRIGKCRSQIKKATNSQLDILDDLSLTGYRRFFGDY